MNFDSVKDEIRGPAALVMAPFRNDLSLDVDALEQNIRYIRSGGLRKGRGFLICPCGTGEYLNLSKAEHRQMVEAAVRATEGDLPVVAGAAGCNMADVIELATNAKRAGASCVMIPPPFYDAVDDQVIFDWYSGIADKVDVGIMVYDQVWRANLGTTVSVGLMERLARIPNVISLKYGSPLQFYQMVEALDRFADRFAFIDNSLGFTSTVGAMHGAAGFISGPSTFWPELELEYWGLVTEGQHAEADRLHARLAPYMRYHQGEEFAGGASYHGSAILKAALEYVGLRGGPLRPPYRALGQAEKERVWATLEQIGARRGAALVEA